MKLFFHKLANWEYWPFQLLYVPIYFQWAWYAIRARSIFFFNACNPSIKNGGFINESKRAIYSLIPRQYYPETELIRRGTAFDAVEDILRKSGISFPFIAKPDIGLRGSAVKKIERLQDLKMYHEKADFDYLLQELIAHPNEIGVFYVRYPDEKHGRVTGIVAKEFLTVIGDGNSTIVQLLRKRPRHEMQIKTLRKEYGDGLEEVLNRGERRNLVPYGNHVRGAKFIDGSDWITPQLTDQIDSICQQIDGFYFGRLDLMYNTLAELERGENFSIVELNGAASEPTHIYDPRHSIWFAWRELARHIRYMYEISAQNHANGIPYLPHKTGMLEYRKHLEQSAKIVGF